MLGTVVNALAIAAGAAAGLFMRTGIPERYRDIVMSGLGLGVILIGIKMALQTQNELIVILSLVLGGASGEALRIEERLDMLGQRLNSLVQAKEGDFVQGFVTASLVFCVGAMAVMGALESGLTGQHKILFAKATIDGISSIVFASTMGAGVVFSALSVFVYQGSITLLAKAVQPFITEAVLAEMTATGGVLIMAIAFNMLSIRRFKAGNLLPALLAAVILTLLAGYIN